MKIEISSINMDRVSIKTDKSVKYSSDGWDQNFISLSEEETFPKNLPSNQAPKKIFKKNKSVMTFTKAKKFGSKNLNKKFESFFIKRDYNDSKKWTKSSKTQFPKMTLGLKMVDSDDEERVEIPEEAVNQILSKKIIVENIEEVEEEHIMEMGMDPQQIQVGSPKVQNKIKKIKFPTQVRLEKVKYIITKDFI